MTAGLDPAKEDALHEYVEEQKRLAAQHKPRKAHGRQLRDERTAQLRRYVEWRKLPAWRRLLGVVGLGRAA